MPAAVKRRSGLKRLVCVVEGRGEVLALPSLCSRILKELGVNDWVVDENPVKQPRSRLVDERMRSPKRTPRIEFLEAAIEMAARRPADAVLVLCDSDDDCAATWGPAASAVIRKRIAGAAVMIVREYESWLLTSRARGPTIDGRKIDEIRDAKRYLAKEIRGYKPTVHQLSATRNLDIRCVRAFSPSFDRLVRSLAGIADIAPGERPLLA